MDGILYKLAYSDTTYIGAYRPFCGSYVTVKRNNSTLAKSQTYRITDIVKLLEEDKTTPKPLKEHLSTSCKQWTKEAENSLNRRCWLVRVIAKIWRSIFLRKNLKNSIDKRIQPLLPLPLAHSIKESIHNSIHIKDEYKKIKHLAEDESFRKAIEDNLPKPEDFIGKIQNKYPQLKKSKKITNPDEFFETLTIKQRPYILNEMISILYTPLKTIIDNFAEKDDRFKPLLGKEKLVVMSMFSEYKQISSSYFHSYNAFFSLTPQEILDTLQTTVQEIQQMDNFEDKEKKIFLDFIIPNIILAATQEIAKKKGNPFKVFSAITNLLNDDDVDEYIIENKYNDNCLIVKDGDDPDFKKKTALDYMTRHCFFERKNGKIQARPLNIILQEIKDAGISNENVIADLIDDTIQITQLADKGLDMPIDDPIECVNLLADLPKTEGFTQFGYYNIIPAILQPASCTIQSKGSETTLRFDTRSIPDDTIKKLKSLRFINNDIIKAIKISSDKFGQPISTIEIIYDDRLSTIYNLPAMKSHLPNPNTQKLVGFPSI